MAAADSRPCKIPTGNRCERKGEQWAAAAGGESTRGGSSVHSPGNSAETGMRTMVGGHSRPLQVSYRQQPLRKTASDGRQQHEGLTSWRRLASVPDQYPAGQPLKGRTRTMGNSRRLPYGRRRSEAGPGIWYAANGH